MLESDDLKQLVVHQLSVATNMIDLSNTMDRWNRFTLANTEEPLLRWANEQLINSGESAAIAEFLIDNLRIANPRNEKRVSANGLVLVEIMAGSFIMGNVNDADGEPDEKPETKVEITYPFWIGKFEVTQGEYEALRANHASLHENPSVFNMHKKDGDSRRPVDNITWEQAIAYCNALTQDEKTRIPPGYEFRLPTEAEWEYACRARTSSPYSFGNSELKLYAWFPGNSGNKSHTVGSRLPNPWGIYDMHGNVMEWCYDWYLPELPGGTVRDFVQFRNTGVRCIRGGSWFSKTSSYLRSSDRYGLGPKEKGWAYGFRVVLGPTIQFLESRQENKRVGAR